MRKCVLGGQIWNICASSVGVWFSGFSPRKPNTVVNPEKPKDLCACYIFISLMNSATLQKSAET